MKKTILTILTLGIYALVSKKKDSPAPAVTVQPVAPADSSVAESAGSADVSDVNETPISSEQVPATETDTPVQEPVSSASATEVVSEPSPAPADSGLAQPPAETPVTPAEQPSAVSADPTQTPPAAV